MALGWLAERGIPSQVAITKAGKLKPMRRAKRLSELADQLGPTPFALIPTSSQSGLGRDALWRRILDSIAEHSSRGGRSPRGGRASRS